MINYEFMQVLECCLLMKDGVSDIELNRTFNFKIMDKSRQVYNLILEDFEDENN